MSRSFHPPDSLSKDDVRTIADLRRDIWSSGFYGMAVGSCTVLALHTVVHLGHTRKLWQLPQPLTRNTAMASFLLGAAAGSLIMATTTGKNEVHNLHPIYSIGATGKQQPMDTFYDERSLDATQDGLVSHLTVPDHSERHRNRLFRRATLTKTMEPGHGGLSDSHGGHWIDEEGRPGKRQ